MQKKNESLGVFLAGAVRVLERMSLYRAMSSVFDSEAKPKPISSASISAESEKRLSEGSLGGGRFESTRWSLVLRLQGGEALRRQAFDELCSAYWTPVYVFLRSQGQTKEEAEDLTQEFFQQLWTGDLLNLADPVRGRFRTLILMGVKRLASNQRVAGQAWKRGGRVKFVPAELDEIEANISHEVDSLATPELAFDRAWALAIMRRALTAVKEEFGSDGKADLFEALAPRLMSGDGTPLEEIGQALGKSEGAIKMALGRLRRTYGLALRAEIRDTLGKEEDLDDEVRYLLTHFQ
jgi:DNA-directed RNA polymerase specialized sigma24 family protein